MVDFYTLNWKCALERMGDRDEGKLYTFEELSLKIREILNVDDSTLRFLMVKRVGHRGD